MPAEAAFPGNDPAIYFSQDKDTGRIKVDPTRIRFDSLVPPEGTKAMSRVLTIRDAKTGALVAEEPLRPNEDEDFALARVYQKTLGPDAPELGVISKSVWLDDQVWAAEIARNWGSFELVVLGPRGEPDVRKARLVLARISECPEVSRMHFPIEKVELDAVKLGRRHDAVVPVTPEDPPGVGDTVTFLESTSDPFGTPVFVPNGESVSVELTKVRNEGYQWVGQDLYYIAWDPAQARKRTNRTPAHGSN